MDPYPTQYQKELQPCNSFNLNRPFNPTASAFDSSPNSKNTTLSFKIFRHPHENISPFPKKFQIPLSLSFSLPSQVSFSVLPKTPFSLSPPKSLFLSSHPSTTLVRQQIAPPEPSPRRKAPSFQVLSHSLSIPRCLTLSLTSPLSSHRFCSTPAKSCPLAGAKETSSLCCHRSSPAGPIKGFAIRVQGPSLG